MRCGFCGKEIPEDALEEQQSCGHCPGGCRKIHCPYCGYENPAPPAFLRRWLKKDERKP